VTQPVEPHQVGVPPQLEQRLGFGVNRAVADAEHGYIDGACTTGHGQCSLVDLRASAWHGVRGMTDQNIF
jgi:hypothetical protein